MKAALRPFLFVVFSTIACSLSAQIDAVLTNPSDCQLNLPIIDNNCPSPELLHPNRFQIQVTNAPGTVLGVDVYLAEVRLIVQHTWANDLDITLQSPGGQLIDLTSDNGGGDDNYGDPTTGDCSVYTSFRSEGTCISIVGAAAPFTDAIYRPEQSFLTFNNNMTNPNGNWILAICDDLVGDTGSLQFVELVFQPISCLAISQVVIDAVDSTTVFGSYTPAAFCGTVIAEYGPLGFIPGVDSVAGQGTVSFVSCSPFILTGLAPGTTYDLYLRRYCPVTGSFSGNTCSVSLTTGCLPGAASELETFDTEATCFTFCGVVCPLTGNWRNRLGDSFDWIVNTGPTLTPGTGPNDDITGGGNYLYIETNGNNCASGSSAYLYSACMTLDKAGQTDCHLSFNYHMRGISVGSLRLQISTDGGFSWATLWQRSGSQGNNWRKAYISLNAYADGSSVQLRFEGAKGLGVYGDIGLDQIQLYGSTFGDFPTQNYYVDADGDGFGQNGTFVLSCLPTAPPGFAPNNLDCADGNASINPAATEIPCNGIDENCSSPGVEDDPELPPSAVTHDTICSGETAQVCATIAPGSVLVWFSDAATTQVISMDSCLTLNLPPNAGPGPVTYRYYAKEFTNQGCFTPIAAEATVIVNPNPAGWVVSDPAICPGDEIDLQQVDLRDTAFTMAMATFYDDFPLVDSNLLTSLIVSPTQSREYPYLLTSTQGCLDSGVIDLSVLTPPQLAFTPADSFSVCLEGTESVTVIPNGGIGTFNYLWSTGATTPTISVAGQTIQGNSDTLQVTVTDAAGCISMDDVIVSKTNNIDSVRVLTTPVSTCGGMNGSFTVIPLNGSAPFTYTWTGTNGGSGTTTTNDPFTLSGLSEGAFRVTITDASATACQVRIRNIRIQGPGFEVMEPAIVRPTCAGDSTGSICVNVSGSNNLTYQWSTGAQTACINSLPAGSYEVTISNGPCTTIAVYEVTQPAPLSLNASLREPSCYNTPNGSISLNVFGGTTPYSVQWSNGSPSLNNMQLLSGDYAVTITDIRGCQLVDTLTLPGPDTLRVRTDSLSPISCTGAQDGYLLVGGQGGMPVYSYLWENGSRSPLRFNLGPGTYSVTLTDVRGCTAFRTYTIQEPAPVQISVANMVLPLCRGDNTGQIELLPQGGTPPYTYLWNGTIQTSVPRLLDQPVGSYTVFATDSRGCTSDTLLVELPSASQLVLSVTAQNPNCVGDDSGSLSLQPGGQAPFTYVWNTGDTTATLIGLEVGAYTVTITDGQGCIYDTTLQVTAPQLFDITPVVEQPSCEGVNDGIILLTVGQSGPGSLFSWNDGSQHVQRYDLSPGDYSFTVTDINGCSYESDTFTLVYPEALRLASVEIGGLNCPDDETGFIETEIVGGTLPYSISWVGQGVNTSDIYGLEAGTYRLLVDDARGCPLDTIFTLAPPPALQATATLLSGGSCIAGAGDTLVASATGGLPPYSYQWTPTVSGPVFINPPADDYALTVVDANNCEIVLTDIKVRRRFSPLQLDSFVVKGVSCFAGNDASMSAYTSGGSDRLQYLFTPTFTDITDTNVVIHAGLAHYNSYSVTVTDTETGCTVSSGSVSPVQPSPLLINRDDFEVVNCFGGSDGALFVSVNGGTAPYSYAWYRQDTLVATTQDIAFAKSGTYTLEVTDANFCTATFVDSSVVTVNEIIRLDSTTTYLAASCDDGNNGGVLAVIAGGVPPYQYMWSTGNMTANLTNVGAGTYMLTVTDSDTCRAIFPNIVVIDSSAAILVTDTIVQHVSCFGANDGMIGLTVAGSSGPYTYVWRRNNILLTNLTGSMHGGLLAGNYNIEIRDAADCLLTIKLTVSQPPLLTTIIEQVVQSATVDLYGITAGGTPPYQYIWSTGSMQDTLTNVPPGTYTLTVTDANGCISETTYLLTALQAIGTADGILSLYPNPNAGDFYLHWNYPEAIRLRLELYDLAGRLLWSDMATLHVDEHYPARLAPLPSGVYQLRATGEDGRVWSGKVVVF